jgi:D-glycerate 3-kinase
MLAPRNGLFPGLQQSKETARDVMECSQLWTPPPPGAGLCQWYVDTVSSDIVREASARARVSPSWLSAACDLPPDTVAELLPSYLQLAQHIALRREAKKAPLTVGIQGPQGAGKSSLSLLLQRVLADVCGYAVATLSIDDLYLTRTERAALAQQVHPLFTTRGVPGTHDVALGLRTLEALTRPGRSSIPRFDKAQDDRLPQSAWPEVAGPADVVLFEGLWIGLPPLDEASLPVPINKLEAVEDPAGVWRAHANRLLAESYPALFARCELLVHLQVPDFACVKRWRSGAEHALRARLLARGEDPSRLMDDAALARFFDHYERFTAHAMACMPAHADVVLQLDREHRVVACSLRR